MFLMFVELYYKDWNKYILLIMMVYSLFVYVFIGLILCLMMFKREIIFFVDLCFERLLEEKGIDYIFNYVYELEENLNNIYEYLKEN